jgi:hypothetical protein
MMKCFGRIFFVKSFWEPNALSFEIFAPYDQADLENISFCLKCLPLNADRFSSQTSKITSLRQNPRKGNRIEIPTTVVCQVAQQGKFFHSIAIEELKDKED